MTEKAPLAQIPGGPSPAEPVPRTPVQGIDLATYAALAVRLAEGGEPRAVVLARVGLDEARWLSIEKTWLLRIATSLLQQDLSLSQEHEEASAVARGALAPPPPLALEEYAALVAGIEAGRDAGVLLAGAKLTPAAFARHKLAWEARLASDVALRASFQALVEQMKRTM
ncbi:hypothetical protein ACMHYB_54400 [Sorangium sp. So ce1128]